MARNTHDANQLWLALGVVAVALVLWVLFAPSDSEPAVEEPVEPQIPVAAVLYDLAVRNGSVDTAPTVNSTGVDNATPNVRASQPGDQIRGSIDAADEVLGAVVGNRSSIVEDAFDVVEGGLDLVLQKVDGAVRTGISQSNDTTARGQRQSAG